MTEGSEIDPDELISKGVGQMVETLAIGEVRIARSFADRLITSDDPTIGRQAFGHGLIDCPGDLTGGQGRAADKLIDEAEDGAERQARPTAGMERPGVTLCRPVGDEALVTEYGWGSGGRQ